MTAKKRRLKLGRLGDHAPDGESQASIAKRASKHDEIQIPPDVGRTRTTAGPAPINEVFQDDGSQHDADGRLAQ